VIAKMKRAMFGPRSERSQRLLDQMELQLEELAAGLGEDAARLERRASRFAALRGARRRGGTFLMTCRAGVVVHPMPASCPCCGGTRLSKIGEDITETLDVVPRR
jgi:transposase